jgi:hypothetical protein
LRGVHSDLRGAALEGKSEGGGGKVRDQKSDVRSQRSAAFASWLGRAKEGGEQRSGKAREQRAEDGKARDQRSS